MSRFTWPALLGLFLSFNVLAQTPAVSPSPSSAAAAPPAKATSAPAAQPTPSRPPTTEEIINSLTAADLQTAMSLLKNHFTSPDAISEMQLNRATLEGLIVRLNNGLLLLPGKESAASEPTVPLYAELLEGHIGYVRAGSLSLANLQAMDKKFTEFAAKKSDSLVLDLRASSSTDFNIAAEFGKRFSGKGKTLFALRKQGKQDRAFVSDRDPNYGGLVVVLADADTAGGAEALAAAVRFYTKALVIGQASAGRAVEYSDMTLPSGKILRVAVSECAGPDGHSLYPHGIRPDLPVDMSLSDKRQIFQVSTSKGMEGFVHEIGRPHMNEAALIAGTNPELESVEARRNRAQANAIHDPVLQRALDLITSLEIYQKR